MMEDEAELLLLFRIKELMEKGYQSERFESLEFLENNKLKIEKIDETRNNLQGMMTSNNNYDYEDNDDDIVIVPLLKKKNIEVPEEKKVENNLSNKGKKWSEEDDKTLMESVKNKESGFLIYIAVYFVSCIIKDIEIVLNAKILMNICASPFTVNNRPYSSFSKYRVPAIQLFYYSFSVSYYVLIISRILFAQNVYYLRAYWR